MGDWRSGSAFRSHRRGRWFEPSIAHQSKSPSGSRNAAGRAFLCPKAAAQKSAACIIRASTHATRNATACLRARRPPAIRASEVAPLKLHRASVVGLLATPLQGWALCRHGRPPRNSRLTTTPLTIFPREPWERVGTAAVASAGFHTTVVACLLGAHCQRLTVSEPFVGGRCSGVDWRGQGGIPVSALGRTAKKPLTM